MIVINRIIKSIISIIIFPTWLCIKLLEITGISKRLTRAAANAIRRDRLALAAVWVFLPTLTLALIGVVFLLSNIGDTDSTIEDVSWGIRAVVVIVTVYTSIYYKYKKIKRKREATKLYSSWRKQVS